MPCLYYSVLALTADIFTDMVDKLCARATNTDIDLLENWIYDSDLARKALVRMIVLHELNYHSLLLSMMDLENLFLL